MSTHGTATIAIILVAAFLLVLVSVGIISLTHNHATHQSQDNCSVQVKKCNEPTHLYHVGAGRCIRNGDSTGDLCGHNMVISPVPTCPRQGQCECDYEGNKVHLVYHDATLQCYFMDTSGPCKDGKVVTISSNGTRLSCKAWPRAPQEAERQFSRKFGTSGGLSRFLVSKCKPGSYQAFIGQCVPVIHFGVVSGNKLHRDED